VDVVDRQQVESDVETAERAPRWAGRRFSLVFAAVALVCAIALPFAPVRMSTPTVSWPQDGLRPVSTMVELTNQQPLAIDVRFSCAAVAAAGGTADGVLLATLVPGQQVDPPDGLLVTVRDGVLQVGNRGHRVLEETPPPGPCAYRVRGTPQELVVERDGVVLATDRVRATADGVLPDVDVLATSVSALPSPDDLQVRLTVDDQFNTTPSPAKKLLIALLLLSTAASVVSLVRRDRAERRASPRRWERGPRRPADRLVVLLDVVVVGTMVLWLFLAPTSDDDGYYAAMARNASAEGFVGNYYQLKNQAFTPFTWFYRLLGWWEHVGDSPTLLRVPALVAGLATWALLRRYVTRPGALPLEVARSAWGRRWAAALLGAAFLAWWLPYGMGVRPEAIVGLLALVSLSAVMTALRTRRLVPVAIAVCAAAFALGCHPTGFVAFGPLLVALPRLVRLVWSGRPRGDGLVRTALVLAPAGLMSAAAFADGSLNDFLRGQAIFLSIQPQDSWEDEYQRYGFLLSPNPMGSYARRAAVLLGIAALVWFLAGRCTCPDLSCWPGNPWARPSCCCG
jgi:hypothetical protein